MFRCIAVFFVLIALLPSCGAGPGRGERTLKAGGPSLCFGLKLHAMAMFRFLRKLSGD